jgi:hypothetical protein
MYETSLVESPYRSVQVHYGEHRTIAFRGKSEVGWARDLRSRLPVERIQVIDLGTSGGNQEQESEASKGHVIRRTLQKESVEGSTVGVQPGVVGLEAAMTPVMKKQPPCLARRPKAGISVV